MTLTCAYIEVAIYTFKLVCVVLKWEAKQHLEFNSIPFSQAY